MGLRLAAIALLVLVSPLYARQSCPEDLPEGLNSEDWDGIQAAYQTGQHRAVPTDEGYQARNPGQQWVTTFDGRGFTVEPDTGEWSWGLELVRYGFAGCEQAVSTPIETESDGGRVTYRWDALVDEWFINDARGLEHGYTVHRRPVAEGEGMGTPLRFELNFRGPLRAEVMPDHLGLRMLDDKGAPALTYAGLFVTDANGKALDARLEIIDEELHLLVDEQGAPYPLTIDPAVQTAYLKASNPDPDDLFGQVAVSGDTVVVGAIWEDSNATGVNGDQTDNSATGSGAAYVFVWNGTTWHQQAYLKASNTDGGVIYGDEFGASVAISGETIVVGAPGESSSATGVNGNQADNSSSNSGAAYVFVRNGTTWSQEAYLKASNTEGGDLFGYRVSISGDSVVVGAMGEDSNANQVNGYQGNGAGNAGAAYVFVRNGTNWSQEAYLKASNSDAVDYFGRAVGISGDIVVVGAPQEDGSATGVNGNHLDNSLSWAGAAYVYVRNGATWSQEAYLKASNTGWDDRFGTSVAVSGNTVVVGAEREDSSATGVNGSQGDGAGESGAAYAFVRNGTTWSQEAYLKASNTELGDNFGNAVSISGDTALVGAYAEDSSATGVNGDQSDNGTPAAGAAYVFVRNGTTWVQEAYLKASNTGTIDSFGMNVAISGDIALVGTGREDSAAYGVNGDGSNNNASNSGAAYAFYLDGPFASATFRNWGTNPASYSATTVPTLGGTYTGAVDLAGTTGHGQAWLAGYRSRLTFPLGVNRMLLVNIGDAAGDLLDQLPASGPIATFDVPIPPLPALAGYKIFTQAVHYDSTLPWVLSNAQDLVLGN